MKAVFSEEYKRYKKEVMELIRTFDEGGENLGEPGRNTIKVFYLDTKKINIKSFKVPNAINKVAYKFFRKSKAERSFYYASHLLSVGIGTPAPVAYLEEEKAFSFGKSYYISEQLPYDLTYRELVSRPDFPKHEEILRAFTRFTFRLHEKKIEFLDHSPGNTLIQLNNGDYRFFLVDLNRMNFRELNFIQRMENFARLTPKKEMVEVMADEYAKLIKKPKAEVFEKMWYFTQLFQAKFHRKQQMKKKLKFWKK